MKSQIKKISQDNVCWRPSILLLSGGFIIAKAISKIFQSSILLLHVNYMHAIYYSEHYLGERQDFRVDP